MRKKGIEELDRVLQEMMGDPPTPEELAQYQELWKKAGVGTGAKKKQTQPLPSVSKIEQTGIKGTAFAFKAADGSDWWMQWTTNSFTDREGENFMHKALENYVDRHRGEAVKGEFWYRHIPGTKFGDVKWQAMVGRFLVQAGPFDDTKIGRVFKEFFQKYPDGHPGIAREGWGTSHGYSYDAKDRDDKVYEWLEIKESTVLPRDVASNPWSPAPRIVKRGKQMNAQERKELEQIGGKAFADMVAAEGEQRTKELENSGVGYKSVPSAMEKLQAMIDGVEDEGIKAGLTEILNELSSDGESEMETEVMEEDMPMAEAEASAGKPKPGCKANAMATKEEVAETLATLTTQLRDEIKASSQATTESIVKAIAPLVEVVNELKLRDADKIAQKVASTPAASLRDMVQSVLDQKQAAVKSDDPLLGSKPSETPMQQRPEGGLPTFLANMLNGK